MENFNDYSSFVFAAYIVAGSLLTLLAAVTLMRYFSLKSKIKNQK